jgi:hypothetical protein
MLRDAAIALSLSNLCYLRVWQELFGPAGYFNNLLSARSCAAAVLNVFLLGAFFWTLQTLARCSRDERLLKLARWVFLVFLIVPLNAIRLYVLEVPFSSVLNRLGARMSATLSLLLLLAGLSVTIRWQRRMVQVATAFLLVLFPLAPIKLGQAAWFIAGSRASVVQAGKAHPQNTAARRKPAQRVLWLLFDEMDQRLAFDERPPSVHLAELDRFQSQAFYGTHAYASSASTLVCVPALMTGKVISAAAPVSRDELMITFAGSTGSVPWSTQANVFSGARELGFRTGVVGWAHPYCRVLASSLTTCSSYGFFEEDHSDVSLGGLLPAQMAGLALNLPLYVRLRPASVTMARRRALYAKYLSILEDAKRAATDRELDLIFVHWPVPHPPWFYDRLKGEFSVDRENTYLDNLGLVDRTLGELRRAMENAGTWDETAVLITSDHSWRESATFDGKRDPRVPFLLRLPREARGITYDRPLSTLVTHDLVLALLLGELRESEKLVRWLGCWPRSMGKR